MGHNNFILGLNKGQTIIEFSLILVVAILAFIAMQPMLKRAVQGNLRNSADSMGEQFSPRWTTFNRHVVVGVNTTEENAFGNLTRRTNRNILSLDDSQTSAIRDESQELRN